jgi:osmoprotectant transport system permease protein
MLLSAASAQGQIRVGSKSFSESRLLAEIFAQTLESRLGEDVERVFDLAGTAICFRALEAGSIDLYPEYTGTGLITILGETLDGGDAASVLGRVRSKFRSQHDMQWLAPLGFENSYELAVRRAIADQHQLATISDLATVAPSLRAAFGYEFIEREDGMVGLARVYGLEVGETSAMQQNLKYAAAGVGRIDLLDVYTTDGLILVHDLVVLDDDRGVFPPYQACALLRGATLRADPRIAAALSELSGLLPEPRMRDLNRQVEVDGASIESVASKFLVELGIRSASVATETTPGLRGRSLRQTLVDRRVELLHRTREHAILVLISLAMATLIALPLAMYLCTRDRSSELMVRAVGLLQTVPSIALLAFMIPLLGVGTRPAIAALFLYALFPILRNGVSGLRSVSPAVVESAKALGMTERQLLLQVRLPLSLPIVIAGIRTSAVICVGTATLAAFIGAGGLGQPIVSGLQLNDSALILSGAIPAALLAWLVDGALALVERSTRATRD